MAQINQPARRNRAGRRSLAQRRALQDPLPAEVEEEVTTIEVIVNPREALSRRERREYRGIETIVQPELDEMEEVDAHTASSRDRRPCPSSLDYAQMGRDCVRSKWLSAQVGKKHEYERRQRQNARVERIERRVRAGKKVAVTAGKGSVGAVMRQLLS
eukprot:CAMPEP_0113879216 /NCGR_PEP_ID=MMETSP0780_2-20120614/7116_1 /TAXON_ID=652834 /ORGANISM="Palpitomonas bilix" /LENGTH=157 /DNA_ID=CAMNT_0000865775 /DNA_START=43 /DNA_END=516 /DNA_ORIENTATION=+ /assembly_acc=CAM_ASM_000599